MGWKSLCSPWRWVLAAACLAAPALSQAGVVGSVEQDGLVVEIHDTQDWCPKGSRSALWVQPQMKVRGCYVEVQEVLYIIWEDGDRHTVKRSLFQRSGMI